MGYRIHTADMTHVAVRYAETPAVYFEDDEMNVGPALVLDDAGNQEAFVIVGTPEHIGRLARSILDALPVALTDEEQAHLTHICEDDVDAGSTGRTNSGWAYFLSGEDATAYDLTNGQEREVNYDDF
jgi:hypothetical protein